MAIWSKLLLVAAVVGVSSAASAAKGVVVYQASSCDYFIAESNTGFVLLEWYGGYTPDRDDVIVGEFESYGMKDIYDITADQEVRVWVEDLMLSKDDAVEQYFDQCN